jgi:hypothetical protein
LEDHKKVEELIIEKWNKISIYPYTYTVVSSLNAVSNKRRYQERYMLILHLQRKKGIQKKIEQIFVDKQQQQEDGFTVVSLWMNYSFFMILL